MTQSQTAVWPAVDPAAGVVAADLPCRRCQYNLRGLAADGRCPECGTPVGFSTRGDFLCYSEPAWVRTLRRGVSAMLWAILVSFGGAVVGGILRIAGAGPIPATVFGLGGGVLSLAGAWLLTTPDPSGLGEDRYGTSRKLIRVTLAVGLGQQLVSLARQASRWPPAAAMTLELLTVVAGLSSLVGTFATLNYLSKLARRMPDNALAARARLVMWGTGMLVGLFLLDAIGFMIVIGTSRGGQPETGPLVVMGVLAVAAVLTLLVFGILYIVMLFRFSAKLREATAVAESIWSHPAAAAPLAGPRPSP